MVIKDLVEKGSEILKKHNVENPFNESLILFAHAFNCQKSYYYSHGNEVAAFTNQNKFLKYINRRKEKVPFAYIIERAYFMSLDFIVKEGVLIPRPDTEILVESTLDLLKQNSKENIKLLDMCTGSGCIGISLAHYDNRIEAVLCDIDEVCIDVANENIKLNDVNNRVYTVKSNLFDHVEGKFDYIVSNPPYIPKADIGELMDDVKNYEPHLALDGGMDGLDFYNRIAREATNYLKKDGYLLFEAGATQAGDICEILMKNYYSHIKVIKDYSGIERVVAGKKES